MKTKQKITGKIDVLKLVNRKSRNAFKNVFIGSKTYKSDKDYCRNQKHQNDYLSEYYEEQTSTNQ